jgi:glycerol-3-phosphate dehydrogenase
VVNAAGPWNDAVRALDEPAVPPSVRPNQGIHVAVPHALFPITGQVIFLAADGHRRLYAIPWRRTSLIGTTDTDYTGDLDAAHAGAEEVAALLESVNQAFAGVRLSAADVVSTFAGLRPLAHGGPGSAYRATRDHHLSVSASGLISICGGKLTTSRVMAQDVMDAAARELGRGAPAPTGRLPLDERLGSQADVANMVETAARAAAGMDDDVVRCLVATYGSRCLEVLRLAADEPALRERLVPGLPFIWAEVPYAVEQDGALALSDVMERRMRLIHEAPGQGLPLAQAVAARMAPLLGWDEAETARQLRAYSGRVALTRRFDPVWSLPEGFDEPT